jgi:hypothetical protein
MEDLNQMKKEESRIEKIRRELLRLETPKAKQAEQIRRILAGEARA